MKWEHYEGFNTYNVRLQIIRLYELLAAIGAFIRFVEGVDASERQKIGTFFENLKDSSNLHVELVLFLILERSRAH